MGKTREILTAAQAETYAREGVVRLPALIPVRDVETMASALWRKIEARPRGEARPSQLSSRTGEFNAMAAPAVRQLLDHLLGEWEEPKRWGVPLVAFHTGEAAWDVPHEHWHLDLGGRPGDLRLARIFAILEPSRPHGGGTGYVAGSHHAVQALADREGRFVSSAQVKRLLAKEHPWFAALSTRRPGEDRVRRFMRDGAEVHGVRLRVCEMLGEPGDVLLMHPLMLHAPMPNVRPTPRMMLTQFVYGRT